MKLSEERRQYFREWQQRKWASATPEELELRRLRNREYAKTRDKKKQNVRQNEYYKRQRIEKPDKVKLYYRAYYKRPEVKARKARYKHKKYLQLVAAMLGVTGDAS